MGVNDLDSWIVTVIGVLLALPLIGISQLGDVTSGIAAWLVAIGVLIVGIKGLVK